LARARLLKPGFFTNELLAELPFEGRLLFAGLWLLADKEGRLEDRPRRIKASLFPWDEVDVHALLTALESKGFIDRYTVADMPLIQIAKFADHQTPHAREAESILPGPVSDDGESPSQARPRFPVAVPDPVPVSGNGSICSPLRVEPFLTFPTQGKPDFWVLTVNQVQEWVPLYDGLDLFAECRKALAWVDANPGRKKTSKGMKNFLVTWFARSVDRRAAERRNEPRGSADRRGGTLFDCPHDPHCRTTGECAVKRRAS
jgi:hypothetical protein